MLHERFGKGKGFRTKCKANDKIFTPKPIAAKIISLCPFEGGQTVLDGFKGGGAFYNQYPENIEKDWCEIDEGRDFFDYRSPINWIVSNPP